MPRAAKAGASQSDFKAEDSLTLVERAYRALKRMILDNELAGGAQLLELEVAALLGMSRTPVREAMIRLSRDGLVDLRARHGMKVRPISAADMKEMYEVLTALEPAAAGLAAARRPSAAEMAPLDKAVADMNDALMRDDLISWAAADERFHLALVDLSANGRLRQLVSAFWEQSHRVRLATLKLRPRPTQSNVEHAALVEAIRRGDAAEAQRIHHEHRERHARMLIGLLDDLGLKRL